MSPTPPSETTWHMGCRRGDIAPTVVVIARAEQAQRLSMQLNNASVIASRREFLTITGVYDGIPISICSAGIGSPPLAIAVEEIHMVGGETLIWIGEIDPFEAFDIDDELPEVVIAWGAVRCEYTTQQYVPLAYPALADPGVAIALELTTNHSELKSKMGIVLTTDIPVKSGAYFARGSSELERYKKAGVLGGEISGSALFITARLLGMRAGAVLRRTGCDTATDETLMQICLGAIKRLNNVDNLSPGIREVRDEP